MLNKVTIIIVHLFNNNNFEKPVDSNDILPLRRNFPNKNILKKGLILWAVSGVKLSVKLHKKQYLKFSNGTRFWFRGPLKKPISKTDQIK